jgi:hypothetical protein
MVMLKTYTITARGWFLFCPVYLTEGREDSPFLEAIPRRACLLPIYDLALGVQMGLNVLIGLIAPDAVGFIGYARPIPARKITLEVPAA